MHTWADFKPKGYEMTNDFILNIEYLPVDQLTPYEQNARKHQANDVDAIVSSIREFGFDDPIGVWGGHNVIVEGHGRVMAAKKLGMKKVPVIHLDHLTDEQRRAYALAHNRTAELSEWDDVVKNLELANISDIDMSLFGFDLSALADDGEAVEDEYDIDAPVEARAKLGDIWRLGQHRLMCGDSTSFEDVDKLMDGQLADLLITDPPYNVNYEGSAGKIKNDNQTDAAFRQFLVDAFTTADSVMKPGAVFYIWHADSEGYNFRGACHDIGWQVRQCLIWNKNSLVMGRQDYQWKHEPCLYGWKDGAGHLWASDRRQTTVIDFNKPSKNDVHPTMKPVGLFDYQIKNNTKGGDIVLDLFGGSGTTIMACEQNGRKAYMMELDPHYVDVIIARWEDFTGQTAELLNEL